MNAKKSLTYLVFCLLIAASLWFLYWYCYDVFIWQQSGTLVNLLGFMITAALALGISCGLVLSYRAKPIKLNSVVKLQDEKEQMDIRNALNFGSGFQEIYKSAAPVIPSFPYVTINGKVPEAPKSFFHSKKFIAIGVAVALFMGFISYSFIFA